MGSEEGFGPGRVCVGRPDCSGIDDEGRAEGSEDSGTPEDEVSGVGRGTTAVVPLADEG